MRRLYYLADDLHLCGRVEAVLREAGIGRGDFHVVSRDQLGLYQHQIRAARIYQRLDVLHAAARWGLAGAAVGLLGSALMSALQPPPWPAGATPVLLCTLLAGLTGAWAGAVAGMSRDSYKLGRFAAELAAGRHLLVVDVHDGNRARVREIMGVHFPSVEFRGRDTTLINPFATDVTA